MGLSEDMFSSDRFTRILDSVGPTNERFRLLEFGMLRLYSLKGKISKSDTTSLYKEYNSSQSEHEKCIIYLNNQQECKVKSQRVFEKQVDKISENKYKNFAKYILAKDKMMQIWGAEGNITTYQKHPRRV